MSYKSLIKLETSDDEDFSDESDNEDKYYQDIKFSNACRTFYISRVDATESFKKNMNSDGKEQNKMKENTRTSIDVAMEKLRKEMASLMDQDLILMKQFLTLNETIENIKVSRRHNSSRDSFLTSSCDVYGDSNWSVTETDGVFVDDSNSNAELKDVGSSFSQEVLSSNSGVDSVCNDSKQCVCNKWEEKLDSGYNSPKFVTGYSVNSEVCK